MGFELDAYVDQRLPSRAMSRLLGDVDEVHVHGVSPSHFPRVAKVLGYRCVDALPEHGHRGKAANGGRPRVFTVDGRSGSRCLCLAVMPGRDYVVHYASLLLHYLQRRRADHAIRSVAVWRYPTAEDTITQWSGLRTLLADLRGHTVIVGKTDLLQAHLCLSRHHGRPRRATYYSIQRYSTPARHPMSLLATHYSHWGEMSGPLTRAVCEAGAREIVYVGKLGTFTSPQDLYSRVFVPSSYALMREQNVVEPPFAVPNHLLEAVPTLDTGLHVSVPTVVEETCRQRQVARTIGASTIDNEVAHMALAVHRWNQEQGTDTAFSALHYASDYLRGPDETHRHVPLSLATGRTVAARSARDVISRFLAMYLETYLATAAT